MQVMHKLVFQNEFILKFPFAQCKHFRGSVPYSKISALGRYALVLYFDGIALEMTVLTHLQLQFQQHTQMLRSYGTALLSNLCHWCKTCLANFCGTVPQECPHWVHNRQPIKWQNQITCWKKTKKHWCTKAAYKAYNMHWTVDRYFMLMRWTAFLFIIGQWGFDEKALQISCESWSRHARGNTSAERRGFQVTNNDMLSCTSFETHTHTHAQEHKH